MDTKIIDGLKVFIHPNRNMTVVVLADNGIAQLKKFLAKNKDAVVSIRPTSYEQDGFTLDIDTFDILNEFDLQRIIITPGINHIKNFSGLYAQQNLLELDIVMFAYFDIDFSYFPKLEKIGFVWSPRAKHFFSCQTLTDIHIRKYKGKTKDLTEFIAFPDLKNLEVIQSTITNIHGIEKLSQLKKVRFAYNTAQEIHFSKLGFVMPKVEDLEINTCRKVGLDFIKVFPNLKRLQLVKFQDLKSLRPILEGLPELEEIFVGETKIEEDDNSYYLNYPKIKKFFFDERKYHKIKNADIGKDW